MVQWLRICLPMQGMQVRSLVGELRAHMPRGNEAAQSANYTAHAPWSLCATAREKPMCHNKEPMRRNERSLDAAKNK